jgi:hypothetical protein
MNHNHRTSTFSRSRDMSIIVACAIIHRDGYKCAYCPKTGLVIKTDDATIRAEIDHIIPRSHGGKAVATNLITCCGRCNRTQWHGKDTWEKAFRAIERAFVYPLDLVKGRELAMMHYPSRVKPLKRDVEVRA